MRLRAILMLQVRGGVVARALGIALALLTSPCAVLGAAEEPTLADAVARLESLRPGADFPSEEGLVLRSGGLTAKLGRGRVSPIVAGDDVVGLFFDGTGSFTFESRDPIEHPILEFNLRKNSSLKAEAAPGVRRVSDSFRRLVWLAPGQLPAKLPGAAEAWTSAAKAGRAPEAFGAAFGAARDAMGRVEAEPAAHLLALRAWNAPQAAAVIAHIEGGAESFRYVLDSFERRMESLELLDKLRSSDAELRGRLFPTTLSEVPVGRDRRDPPVPPFLLTDVRLDVAASSGDDVTVIVEETVRPIGSPLRALRFDLRSVFYDVVGRGTLEARELLVRKVSSASGEPLSFAHENGQLLVGLPAPAQPGAPVSLRFEIAGPILIRPAGDNYWSLPVDSWFPQPDLAGQLYTLRTRVKVPKPFVPFACGKTVRRWTEGSDELLETELDTPTQFGVVLAGKYAFQEETRRGVTVRVASYAGKNPRAWKQLTDLAFGVIEYYEHFLGPFPFPELNILEINDYGFGQAPPGVVFITKEAFNPTLGELNQLFSQGINERFAHEIAHMYWGHVVKMPSLEEQWITESFAEYSAALFLRRFRGDATFEQLRRTWKSRAKFAHEASPIPLANRVRIPSDYMTQFQIRTGLIYDKGSLLLAAIDEELEDTQFLTFLKSYQKSFRWKFGSTRTVDGLLEFLTKKDWSPFFEKYYWGTELPPMK